MDLGERILYNTFVRIPGELKSCTCPAMQGGDACDEYYKLGSCHNPDFERTFVSEKDSESDARKIGM